MNKKKHLLLVVPFLLIISGIGIINMLTRDKLDSKSENRNLQQVPGIENIINKDYSKLYEEYYTDQFLGRDLLLKLYTKLEIAIGKSNVRDHYIIDNEWILPYKEPKKNQESLKSIAKKLNSFAKNINKEGRDIYYVSTPAKNIALDHLYPKYAENGYGLDNIINFSDKLNKEYIKPIIIDKYFKDNYNFNTLEKFYFKTDHHWNGYGAFEGFKYIVKSMNYLDLFDYNRDYSRYNERTKLFLGSYNRNLFSIFSKYEEIPYIYKKGSDEYKYFNYNGNEYVTMDKKLIISPEISKKEVTYGGAYTYDNPLYKVVNEKAPIKKKVIIIRDSFQAPTTLMFSYLFETVEILDPRNDLGLTASKVIDESNPDIVIFMFNSSTFDSMIDLVQ